MDTPDKEPDMDIEIPKTAKLKGVVDIVFLIDATGSMYPCIDAIKENIKLFVDVLTATDANHGTIVKDWRARVCGYRDHFYDAVPFIEFPFVRDASELKQQLESLEATGGGDEPETLLDALYSVLSWGSTDKDASVLDPKRWRYSRDAARVVIIFTDASAHPTIKQAEDMTIDDLRLALNNQRIWLYLFAPKHQSHGQLAKVEKSRYQPVGSVDPNNPTAAVEALRDFTSNKENFQEVLTMLAKSVSQSSVADL